MVYSFFGANGLAGVRPAHPRFLRAAVEAPALEFQAVERLHLGKFNHRVGELDLAAGAALLGGKNVEDAGLQDVAAGDDEIRRRPLTRGFLDRLGDREQAAPALADADNSI